MSLINCPECGHEVSTSALECPNCGRPLHRPAVVPDHVVSAVPVERSGFPNWAFIPIGILGALLLLVFFLMIGRNNDEEANGVNINVSARRAAAADTRGSRTESQTVTTVPPATDTQVVTTAPPSQTSVATIPGAAGAPPAPPSDRGAVVIDAKVTSRNGSPQAVKNEKFYLLDDDLESILNKAGLEPIDGQSLTNSLGLAVLYPDRYQEFYRDALKAINHHIKYSAQTDGAGKAQMGDIKPDSYYLFGVTKTGKGFAVWSSPVVINAGQNALNLSPQPLTEMDG